MALRLILVDEANLGALDVQRGINGSPTLIAESLAKLEAHWKVSTITSATTTTVVEAKSNESIMLTDLIITSTKKVASSNITFQFYDGTNTEIMGKMEAATAPVNFSHAFSGGLKGWKDADFQIVTDQDAMEVTVMVGYVHISEALTLEYDKWNAER